MLLERSKSFMTRLLMTLLLLGCGSFVNASELYRYQDSNGRWVFGDKKSLGNNHQLSKKAEKIKISGLKTKRIKPEFVIVNPQNTLSGNSSTVQDNSKTNDREKWKLSNPLPVDIQHWLRVKGQDHFFTFIMAKPNQTIMVDPDDYNLAVNHQPIEHYYLLGKPIDKPKEQYIPLPYLRGKQFRISQGFNGKYSHTGRGSRYAVDIAMPIGTTIAAVKSGIVADLRDDFAMGGPTNYFLDKANHVTVMHKDGSYAIYAHILYGSAKVSVGDAVNVGDALARVGNTGFSTGPHLHFVLSYNSGKGSYSIPFKFKTAEGTNIPTEGEYYTAQ